MCPKGNRAAFRCSMAVRPNILLITTDQQRWDTIHALGNQSVFTPHLDWLCGQGITFTNCYSDNPVCMPARATIMTGMHAYNHGLLGNSENEKPMALYPTLPGMLTAAGYQTRAQGKMHFHPLRANYGFEHMEILSDYYRFMAAHPERGVPMDHGVGQNEMDPVISTVSDSNSLTHWTVDRSIDFLETRDESRPFFLWTSFAKPHPPFDPVKNYWDLYSGITLPDPVYGNWSVEPGDVPAGYMQPTWVLNNVHRLNGERLAATRRAYYACISQIDYNLGLLFARMRELGRLEDTWIIFTADHGEMLGDHHMGAKSTFFEGSAHIPCIIRPPTTNLSSDPNRGVVCRDLVCLADILPTCLDMGSIKTPPLSLIDGINLLDGEYDAGQGAYRCAQTRERLIGQCGDFHAVISATHKYHFAEKGGAELLFDIEADPMETRDLIREGECGDIHARLASLLHDHLARRNHPSAPADGLQSSGPPPNEREARSRAWPGFHSMGVPSGVVH